MFEIPIPAIRRDYLKHRRLDDTNVGAGASDSRMDAHNVWIPLFPQIIQCKFHKISKAVKFRLGPCTPLSCNGSFVVSVIFTPAIDL